MSVQDTDAAIEAALEKEMDFKDGDETSEATEGKEAPPVKEGTEQQQPAVEAGTAKDTGTTPAGEAAKEPVPTTEKQPEQLTPHPVMRGYNLDTAGNITDAQGQIVASAGRERRWFETSDTLRGYIAHQKRENDTLNARIEEISSSSKDALNGIPTQLGLTTEEVNMGLKLSANFKSDPVATARYIVAEAMKMGYNLEQIVETTGSNNINMAAIKQLLDERLGPIAAERLQNQEAASTQQKGQAAYERFMQQFPDAVNHQDMIAAVMKDNRVTAEDAYFQLRTWANTRGYDFSQPLQPQMQRATPPANAPSTAPLPNGSTTQSVVTNTPQIASEDTDYDDIIRDAMREAGMAMEQR